MIDLKYPRFVDLSGRSMIDLPVAALAGLSVAFAAFTIPAELLTDAIGATGLASLIPTAQPPLGSTARFAMAVVGALATFGAAFMLLRWLDRFASRPVEQTSVPRARAASPRLNRADSHPDAPPRRPLSASRDLGEPAPSRPSEQWLEDLQAPAAPPAPPAPDAAKPASLGVLMARLESGLAKRGSTEPAAGPAPRAPVPTPVASDRLQGAIDSLQRLAARHG